MLLNCSLFTRFCAIALDRNLQSKTIGVLVANKNNGGRFMKKFNPHKLILGLILFFGGFFVLSIQAENLYKCSALQSTCGDIEVVLTPSTGTYNDEIEIIIDISDNQCELSAIGFDLYYDISKFAFLGVENQNCLTSDWSMLDGYEISPGLIRVGGLAGIGTPIQPGQNGSIVIVRFKVTCPCGTCFDGEQTAITIDSYVDHLESFLPQPAQGIFTFVCCCGTIALPLNKQGTWGDLVRIPVSITDNTSQICDFEYDFVFDPSALDFKGVEKSSATQDWTTVNWNPVSPGKVRITGQVGSGACIPIQSTVNLAVMGVMIKCVEYSSETPIPMRIEAYKDGISCACPRSLDANLLYKPCPRLGDVNGDETITPGDAQVTFEIYLGMREATVAQLTTADANCSCPCEGKEHTEPNNCLTPWDAQWIFDHYLGKRVLPLCCADYVCGEGSGMSTREAIKPSVEKRVVYPLPTIGNSKEMVMIPVMIDHPEGIQEFSLEMCYPHDLLEYEGLWASPLTQGFEYVRGDGTVPGVIRIEGWGEGGIATAEPGSLSVAVFHVRENVSGSAHIVLGNLSGDIYGAVAGSSTFVCGENFAGGERNLTLGPGKAERGVFVIPVEVTNAFNIKAFGVEVKFPADKMIFLGVEPTDLTGDFLAVDGNEIENGVIRVGGYSMSGIQDMAKGALVRLVFQVKESGGQVEIVRVVDDLQDFLIYY